MATKPAMLGIALTACLGLAACSGGGGLSGGRSGGTGAESSAVSVLAGDVVLAAPPGYCEDPVSTRRDDVSAFVLFGSCRAITGSGKSPTRPAVLTAAVSRSTGPLTESDFAQLAGFLATPEGKASLSRGGDASEVEVETILHSGDLIFIRARDAGERGMDPAFWRAIFPESGALVTLTVSSLATAQIPEDSGKALVTNFVAAIKAANTKTEAETGPDAAEPILVADPERLERDPNTVGTKPGALRAFFERLL
ncbi:hypothetical protein [Maritimibacter dapengensis]|uniref:Lipoprotein n=1 Tax=Maritimibacter dapengensis TaxID=2836868 RepID=A0ABS6SWX0_9RHOB|nr:hypothetical protein [Maritimibacter dapengensis]MBV7377452.1 hypothetical protein [Maritimibacter dapengensis]